MDASNHPPPVTLGWAAAGLWAHWMLLHRVDARRLLGLLLRYYIGDTAAGQAGFEIGAGVNYETVRIFNEQPHQFDMEGYLRLHNSPTASD
jgi:hypothetical protein|eukprot:COSAG06_NODE_10646_length_1643_cov_1.558290_2_plen_91_part_00